MSSKQYSTRSSFSSCIQTFRKRRLPANSERKSIVRSSTLLYSPPPTLLFPWVSAAMSHHAGQPSEFGTGPALTQAQWQTLIMIARLQSESKGMADMEVQLGDEISQRTEDKRKLVEEKNKLVGEKGKLAREKSHLIEQKVRLTKGRMDARHQLKHLNIGMMLKQGRRMDPIGAFLYAEECIFPPSLRVSEPIPLVDEEKRRELWACLYYHPAFWPCKQLAASVPALRKLAKEADDERDVEEVLATVFGKLVCKVFRKVEGMEEVSGDSMQQLHLEGAIHVPEGLDAGERAVVHVVCEFIPLGYACREEARRERKKNAPQVTVADSGGAGKAGLDEEIIPHWLIDESSWALEKSLRPESPPAAAQPSPTADRVHAASHPYEAETQQLMPESWEEKEELLRRLQARMSSMAKEESRLWSTLKLLADDKIQLWEVNRKLDEENRKLKEENFCLLDQNCRLWLEKMKTRRHWWHINVEAMYEQGMRLDPIGAIIYAEECIFPPDLRVSKPILSEDDEKELISPAEEDAEEDEEEESVPKWLFNLNLWAIRKHLKESEERRPGLWARLYCHPVFWPHQQRADEAPTLRALAEKSVEERATAFGKLVNQLFLKVAAMRISVDSTQLWCCGNLHVPPEEPDAHDGLPDREDASHGSPEKELSPGQGTSHGSPEKELSPGEGDSDGSPEKELSAGGGVTHSSPKAHPEKELDDPKGLDADEMAVMRAVYEFIPVGYAKPKKQQQKKKKGGKKEERKKKTAATHLAEDSGLGGDDDADGGRKSAQGRLHPMVESLF